MKVGNQKLANLFSALPNRGAYKEGLLVIKNTRKAAYRRVRRYTGDCKSDCDCDCSPSPEICGGCA